MKKRRVIVLGSSGSIGTSACKVARALPEKMEIVGLAVSRSVETMAEQAREFGVKHVTITNEHAAADAKEKLPKGCKLFSGERGLVELVEETDADMVLVAIVGTAGLAPALAALKSGKDLAVASKEILVMAGEAVTTSAKKHKKLILPVDSEHNAIFQCIEGAKPKSVSRLILTASGGPFRQTSAEDLRKVTVEQALKHPTWKMGRKITIDSATLFNKGLEMIEAHWLFGMPMSQVDVIVHPQSIVHSMVEFVDHSILAQLSLSDMCFPIQYAVTYPERVKGNLPQLDLAKIASLTFESPDPKRFPALRLAREAGEAGGTLPAVFNAANEIAVEKFLHNSSSFPKIWETVEKVMQQHHTAKHPTLEQIIEADHWARKTADSLYH